MRPAGTRTVRRGRGMDRDDGAVVQDKRHREPPRTVQGPSRGDPQTARVVRRGRERSARSVRGTTPVPATRAGMAAHRARTDPASKGRHRRRRASIAGRSPSRVGPAARSRAGPTGPRRHHFGGGLDTKRSRAPSPGAFEGAATGHRVAAGAAARGAGRDRDRGRQPRSGPLSRRGAAARCRPIPQQGAGRRRHPCSGTGATRGGRRGGRGTVLLRGSATLERSRGAL